MKRALVILFLGILLTTLVSADIVIQKQPNEIYSVGDVINLPLKIAVTKETKDLLTVNLLCNGNQVEIQKGYIWLKSGEEESITSTIPLIQSTIGSNAGICKLKTILGEEFYLSKEFEISDKIQITIKTEEKQFNPGENFLLKGEAIKENGEAVTGFIEIISPMNGSLITETVKNGYFETEIVLPKDIPAGEYQLNIHIYEKDFEGAKTNQGNLAYISTINQIPTSLEIVFEDTEILPGNDLEIRAILHDQTGQKIPSNAIVTIKDSNDAILFQEDVQTDEVVSYPIKYNEAPSTWTAVAVSNRLNTETEFTIAEKQDIEIVILNKTVTVTNIGNVPYTKLILVKIGTEIVEINNTLRVDESKTFVLSAPDGQYNVEVLTDDGSSTTQEGVFLTGNAISIKESSATVVAVMKHPIVWIFLILLLAFVAYMFFKKGYQKTFIGYIKSKKSPVHLSEKPVTINKNSLVSTQIPAELSLSLKGNKQETSIVCMRIKNLKEIQSKKGGAEETLQKIVSFVESNKGAVYENNENIYFIFAPVLTKTFKNEKTALNISQKVQTEIKEHNRKFKDKMEIGIGINNGTIVAKQENGRLKFMSMGTLLTNAKKLAVISKGDILLGSKTKEKLTSEIKTQKHQENKVEYYSIKEIKNSEANQKFISNFIKRLEHDKRNQENNSK